MNEYVVMKLVSGETLIAQLLNETKDGVHVINPLQVKLVPMVYKDGEYGENAISSRFCQFTEEIDFTFNHKDLIYCKPLNPKMQPIYNRLIESFNNEAREPSIPEEVEEEDNLQEAFSNVISSKKLH